MDHRYSLLEQADLVEALWRQLGIASTRIVAHDYAVSVAQELLARRADGDLAVELEGLHLLNGGVYPDLHRPQPLQVALLDPEQGPQISQMVNRGAVRRRAGERRSPPGSTPPPTAPRSGRPPAAIRGSGSPTC